MDKERIKKIVLKTIEKLPKKFRFELIGIEEYQKLFSINLKSRDKKDCQIFMIYGKFDELKDEEFIGAIAHELAHYWTGGVSEDYKKIIIIYRWKSLEEYYRKKGFFRKADGFKKKYLSLLKTKKDLEELKEAYREYGKIEEKTDNFAKERFGLKEEIDSMRKVCDELELSLEFKRND